MGGKFTTGGSACRMVTEHPELGVAARHAAIDFELAEDPKPRDLAVCCEGSEKYSAYYKIPRNAKDLLARSKLIEIGTAEGATLVLLVKEIGTDALFALRRVLARTKETRRPSSGWRRSTRIAATAILRWPWRRPM